MRKYDVILFDLDGTITDSKEGVLRCIRIALDRFNVSYTQEILDKMVGPPFRVSMKELCGVNDEQMIEDMISVYRADYEVKGWRECSVYDGIENLLMKLNEHKFRVGMATSKPIKFTSIMMKELDLEKYFEFIGGASSDSSRDTKSDVINHVLANMKITDKSRVLMVGDRLYDIEGAKQSGIDSCGILWGYGDEEELSSHGANYLIGSPEELFDFLAK